VADPDGRETRLNRTVPKYVIFFDVNVPKRRLIKHLTPLKRNSRLIFLGNRKNIFEKEKTLKRLQPKIKFLDKSLKRFYNLAHVNEVRQLGFMVGIELVKNKKTKEPYAWEEKIGVKVCQEVRKAGLILRPLGNVIVLMPPLAIEIEELKKILEITYRAIERITEKK